MSIILRDPLLRDLLLTDYERDRMLRPYRYHVHQPMRVHRYLNDGWPMNNTFDHALNELQSVMDNVNEAIGHYQNHFAKDLEVGGMRTSRTEDGNLQLAVDVSQFKPEEIHVKVCDDNLVVEAKTESSESDSYHKAEFKRWIKLPQDCKQDAIKSTLTADKKLLVEVPVSKPIENSRSRSIPISVQKEAIDQGKQQQKEAGDAKQNGQK